MADGERGQARILLAEDFDDTRQLYAEVFSRAGYQVVAAANGEEALQRASEHRFDVVVLDVGLPKVNGLTVIRILRSRPETRRVPIVTVSAAVGAQLHKAIIDAGADAALDKPCLPEELETTVRACLERRRAGDAGSGATPAAREEPGGRATALVCPETAYYLDRRLPLLALVAKGVRMPRGEWVQIAGGTVSPSQAEELVPGLLPALQGAFVPFVALLTSFDVGEFEKGWPAAP